MLENSSLGKQTSSSLSADEPAEDCLTEDFTAAVVLKSLAYFVILLVSLVGNVLITLVVWKNKKLHKSINYFVFNMALSDLFTPLTIMPIKIVEIILGSGAFMVHSPLILGNVLCEVCYFSPWCVCACLCGKPSVDIVGQACRCCLSTEVKTHHIESASNLPFCSWIIAIAVHSPYFNTLRLFPQGYKYYCEYDWEPAFDHDETSKRYITATYLAIIAVPIILIIAYAAIAWSLKRRRDQREMMSVSAQSCGYQQNRQIFLLSVAIVTAFIVCLIPHLVVRFCTIFLWHLEDSPICAFQTVIPFVALFMVYSWSTCWSMHLLYF